MPSPNSTNGRTHNKLKIELVPVSSVIEYARNARLHSEDQIRAVAKSISEFGFVNPCLVDADGVLIAGHCRVLSAKQLGIEIIPIIRLGHLTETQARALRLADNALPLQSTWDVVLLKTELSELKLTGYDIPLLGFPETQLRAIGFAVGNEGNADPEQTPPAPAKPVTKRGDLWLLGEHRILCGDATSESDVATCLGGEKPHLMVTDPPYGVEYDPDWRNRADRANGKPYGARAVGLVTNDDQADWRAAWALFHGDVIYAWSPAGSKLLQTGGGARSCGI